MLGVLPGTGGLTRLTDKRHTRRDHADIFCTLVEGVRAQRAQQWRLIDGHAKPQQFAQVVKERALALAATSDRPADAAGIALTPLKRTVDDAGYRYEHVDVRIDRRARCATITVSAPKSLPAEGLGPIVAAGASWWPLAMARELDDAILLLRTNELDIGTWVLKTAGDASHVLAADATLLRHQSHWFVRETIGMLRRTLARLDVTSRTLFALIEPGSCFAGTLLELALAADRSYMLALPDVEAAVPKIVLSKLNFGAYPMVNGEARLVGTVLWRVGTDRAREGGHRPTAWPRTPRWSSASSLPRPTSSTGPTKCGWRWKSARACRLTRSPEWKRTCASAASKRWKRACSAGCPRGRTGSSSGRTRSARPGR